HEVWTGGLWIDSHRVHPDLDLVGGIIGRRPMLSTAGDGAQGCILFVAGRPGRGLGIPVGEKRQHNRQNHEEGGDAKHPMRRTLVHDPANNSGLAMPLKLKPVETMPKARPAAPAGAAPRTSMS